MTSMVSASVAGGWLWFRMLYLSDCSLSQQDQLDAAAGLWC